MSERKIPQDELRFSVHDIDPKYAEKLADAANSVGRVVCISTLVTPEAIQVAIDTADPNVLIIGEGESKAIDAIKDSFPGSILILEAGKDARYSLHTSALTDIGRPDSPQQIRKNIQGALSGLRQRYSC